MEAITVTLKGPIFDGRAPQAGRELAIAITDRVGTFALQEVQKNLNRSIRNPTPYYETQVEMKNRAVYDRLIWDRGIIYGPWLEGTGSRNQTTRFKGYQSFRRAASVTRSRVKSIAVGLASQYARRMGGS